MIRRANARARSRGDDADTMLWRVVVLEDLAVQTARVEGYAVALPVIDELMETRRMYRPSARDRRRSLPRTPIVRGDRPAAPDRDSAIVFDPALFGPLSNDLGMGSSPLVLSDQREAVRRAVTVASHRMLMVNEEGHEYASIDEYEAELEAGRDMYTPNYVSEAIEVAAGIRLYADVKDGDYPEMDSRWRQVLCEEFTRAGVTAACVIPDPYPADSEHTY